MLAWLEGGGRADATYERGKVSGLTLLMGTAMEGHERLVDLLLRYGAKVDLQDSDGDTALTLAASRGHERVVELLLRHGAEVNLQNPSHQGSNSISGSRISILPCQYGGLGTKLFLPQRFMKI